MSDNEISHIIDTVKEAMTRFEAAVIAFYVRQGPSDYTHYLAKIYLIQNLCEEKPTRMLMNYYLVNSLADAIEFYEELKKEKCLHIEQIYTTY